jgi:antitoxin (DNA-binding transcriptional repressor) of toxin-antitoxin stability system
MKTVSISVTEAARNFAEYISRAHYQNTTFILLKNGAPVARIVPDHAPICTGRDLAEVLKETNLSAKEARAWYRDLQMARGKLKAPEDKWQ